MPESGTRRLAGKRLLVVEDDYLIATEVADQLRRRGAEVVGPAPTLQQGMRLLETAGAIDGAVLDVNLRGERVFALADELAARKVPMVFLTGYDESAFPAHHAQAPRCDKPVDADRLAALVAERLPRGQ